MLQAILESTPNDPKTAFNTTRSRYPMYELLVPISPKFKLVSLYTNSFRLTDHTEQLGPNDLKVIVNTIRPRFPQICVTSFPSPKIHSVLLQG